MSHPDNETFAYRHYWPLRVKEMQTVLAAYPLCWTEEALLQAAAGDTERVRQFYENPVIMTFSINEPSGPEHAMHALRRAGLFVEDPTTSNEATELVLQAQGMRMDGASPYHNSEITIPIVQLPQDEVRPQLTEYVSMSGNLRILTTHTNHPDFYRKEMSCHAIAGRQTLLSIPELRTFGDRHGSYYSPTLRIGCRNEYGGVRKEGIYLIGDTEYYNPYIELEFDTFTYGSNGEDATFSDINQAYGGLPQLLEQILPDQPSYVERQYHVSDAPVIDALAILRGL